MKIVTAAIIIEDNKIFIAQRQNGDSQEGKWEFPGGKLESGEDDVTCLERELTEEFGVKSQIGNFFMDSVYEYERGVIKLRAYFVKLLDKNIRLNVHQSFRWINISQLMNFDLSPADIPIAEKISCQYNRIEKVKGVNKNV